MSDVEIRFPKAHSDIQLQIMKSFMTPDVREIWVACGSKFGKSLAAGAALGLAAPRNPGTYWRWVAPIYTQSVIGMRYMQRLLPGRPHVEVIPSAMKLRFPFIDTDIQFCHGQDPESLEGEATHGNVLDECSKMKEQVYNSVKTTTTVTRGPILAISTPRGKNWFYKKCMAAQDEMMRAAAEGRNPRQLFITAPTTANPHVTVEAIEEARRNLPERLFKQYILAEFVDDADVFSGYRQVIDGPELTFFGEPERWVSSDSKERTVVIGADWAKTHDYTVFTAFDIEGDRKRLVGFQRFQGIQYTDAVKMLVAFSRKFKETSMVFHDKTGLGQVIDELMDKTGLPFQGIVFSSESKSQMVNQLMLAMQVQELLLPNWQNMCREFDSFEVTTNEIGRMRYNAASGQHDDIVCSLMLCWYACLQFGNQSSFGVVNLESLKDVEQPMWYDSQDNDW
ncbi:MAG: hypothetical protein ACRC1W_12900 [Shewanella sp.]